MGVCPLTNGGAALHEVDVKRERWLAARSIFICLMPNKSTATSLEISGRRSLFLKLLKINYI
jgi:hypothetical protein